MIKVTLLFIVLHMALLPDGLCAKDTKLQESGADEQVGVTLHLDRKLLAPGESFKVWVTRKVLGPNTLRFLDHYCDAAFAQFHVKTPDGRVFVYWPYSSPRKSVRPPKPTQFRASLRSGHSHVILVTQVVAVNPSPEWLVAETEERAQPDFRAVGTYEAWIEHRIPKIDDIPADAWHGYVRSSTVRFVVREIPLADRRKKPTVAQLADIKMLMRGKADRMKPLERMEVCERLKKALARTENEGLAGHIATILKKHQPRKASVEYPLWWGDLATLLSVRACRSGVLGIKGPYLPTYASLSLRALEHRMAESSARGTGLRLKLPVDTEFLIVYSRMGRDQKAVISKRLGDFARLYAKIPPTGSSNAEHHQAHSRLWSSWRILFALGILHDDMPLSEATQILGKPRRSGTSARWFYSSNMHVNPVLTGEIAQGAKGETVRFPNKQHLK